MMLRLGGHRYRPDDTMAPNYFNDGQYPDLLAPGTIAERDDGLVPVVALNCSRVPACHLDGITITSGSEYGGSSAKPAPAIRVYSGWVNSATITSSQLTGKRECVCVCVSHTHTHTHTHMVGGTCRHCGAMLETCRRVE